MQDVWLVRTSTHYFVDWDAATGLPVVGKQDEATRFYSRSTAGKVLYRARRKTPGTAWTCVRLRTKPRWLSPDVQHELETSAA